MPLAACPPLPQPAMVSLPLFRHLRTPNQLLYPSQLPLCQSLGPSLTDGLAPLSSRLLGLKGSAQHLARRVALVSGNAQHCLQEGSGTKLSWGRGTFVHVTRPFRGRCGLERLPKSAAASHAACFSFEVARPDSRSDQCTNTYPGHTHPCTRPHTCPYQHILLHKASLISQEF